MLGTSRADSRRTTGLSPLPLSTASYRQTRASVRVLGSTIVLLDLVTSVQPFKEQTACVVSVPSASVAERGLWRRYRAPLIAALPAGLMLGAIAGLLFSVNTVHAAPQDQLPALLAYVALGAAFALTACTGAVLAVLIGRPRAETVASQCWYIAIGAGAAVCTAVLIAGALSAAITDSWEWYSFYIVIALGTGIAAAASAGGITAFFQYRPHLLP